MRLFPMNSCQARARLVQAGSLLAAVALIAGCGDRYRPVVTPIGTNGPAPQPTSYALTVSAPSTTTPGIATIIDYSGDSVLAIAPIGPGPTSFTVDALGDDGYTVNSDGTLSNFPVSPALQAKQVTYTTLASTAEPVNLFSPSVGLWAADLNGNVADVFAGLTEAFKLAIPVAPTPVTIVGLGSIGQRNYAISQNIPATSTGVECNISPWTSLNGVATAMETSSYTVSANIVLDPFNPTNSPTGTKNALCPVYAVQSPDNRRFFVLNRGSDTVTVINSQLNTLDGQCPPPTGCVNQSGQTYFSHPVLPLSTTAVTATGITPPNGTSGMTTIAGPVYAEYSAATAQLVVAAYDGGTIRVIDVSRDEYGNDTPPFETFFTVKVGQTPAIAPYPASVTVLADGSRAYTANQADGTVAIVNLSSHSVEKWLNVIGHPRSVVSTQNSSFGKVYVASPNSPYLTILRTDLDIVDTTILVEGNIVDVRVTTQTGTSGNRNAVSRVPGYGEPCNVPPTPSNPTPAPTGTQTLLQACQALP